MPPSSPKPQILRVTLLPYKLDSTTYSCQKIASVDSHYRGKWFKTNKNIESPLCIIHSSSYYVMCHVEKSFDKFQYFEVWFGCAATWGDKKSQLDPSSFWILDIKASKIRHQSLGKPCFYLSLILRDPTIMLMVYSIKMKKSILSIWWKVSLMVFYSFLGLFIAVWSIRP